jgi:hypothetical protein
LHNMTDPQIAIIYGLAHKLAMARAESWTGELSFSIPINQGGVTDNVRINRTEVVRMPKARRIRSHGLR